MTTYTDRIGQRIGDLVVLEDHGRTKRGQVIWRCLDEGADREKYVRTYELIRLDREHERGEKS